MNEDMTWRSLYNYMISVNDLFENLKKDIIKDRVIRTETIMTLNKAILASNQTKDLLNVLENENVKLN